jgi:hypothetical protein
MSRNRTHVAAVGGIGLVVMACSSSSGMPSEAGAGEGGPSDGCDRPGHRSPGRRDRLRLARSGCHDDLRNVHQPVRGSGVHGLLDRQGQRHDVVSP